MSQRGVGFAYGMSALGILLLSNTIFETEHMMGEMFTGTLHLALCILVTTVTVLPKKCTLVVVIVNSNVLNAWDISEYFSDH